MTEIENTDFLSLAVAIAVVSEKFNLNAKEFGSMLELLGCVTHEQCEMIGFICSAFKVRENLNSQTQTK